MAKIDLNTIETDLVMQVPMVTRLSSQAKPAVIGITIPKNHNPDFALFYPTQGKGIFVETKGPIRDRSYLLMLEHFPPGLKKIYKVLLYNSSKKEREKVGRRLRRIGIDYSEFVVKPEWIAQAAALYSGTIKLSNEELAQINAVINAKQVDF